MNIGNNREMIKQTLLILIMIILPWVAILSGLFFKIYSLGYFLVAIVWFALGIIFFIVFE